MEQKKKPTTTFEAAALNTCFLEVKDLEGAFQSYTLVMDFNAIAKAHVELNKDLSSPRQWQNLSGSEITVVCWCAFDRCHPEVTLIQVRQMLSPAQSASVFNMLLELSFPGITEKLIAVHEAAQKAEAEGQQQNAPDPMKAGSL